MVAASGGGVETETGGGVETETAEGDGTGVGVVAAGVELAVPGATVFPALKPEGRVMPLFLAQVAGSSPYWRMIVSVMRLNGEEGWRMDESWEKSRRGF